MANLMDIEGVGEVYATTLAEQGITTTDQLLEMGATPQGRQEICDKCGISMTLVLNWVNRVDLFRIHGVQEEYADLLERAGVDTVVELGTRNPENLHQALLSVNGEKHLVRQPPSQAQVAQWIAEAKTLPRVIQY